MINKIFEVESLDLAKILAEIKSEYKRAEISRLGGTGRESLILWLSLDKKENWANNIYHNSKYYIFHLSISGELENFSRGNNTNKIRKKRVKNIGEAIEYINKKIGG